MTNSENVRHSQATPSFHPKEKDKSNSDNKTNTATKLAEFESFGRQIDEFSKEKPSIVQSENEYFSMGPSPMANKIFNTKDREGLQFTTAPQTFKRSVKLGIQNN